MIRGTWRGWCRAEIRRLRRLHGLVERTEIRGQDEWMSEKCGMNRMGSYRTDGKRIEERGRGGRIVTEKKILVVDDQKSILKLFKSTFEMKGYMVATAESGEEALGILKEEEIRVMFLDLKMPGMNGLDLCREIRKTHAEARIFAVTGHPSLFQHSNCLAAGFDLYFTKPMNLELLVDTARDAFADLEKQDQTHKT